MKGINDNDCEHAQQLWNTLEKKTLGCYHTIYFKTDVLMWADVLENFPNTCLTFLNYCKLDPEHFFTAPGLAWQGLLKSASEYCVHEVKPKYFELFIDEFRLELLGNIDVLLMF